ncbi:hypothetical protein SAMN05421823_111125 [Catalinimonas alkaloidigena]|uniref:Uncharacterized protein n=1 Tax=Catalinimonas alkaloidigena TaxID=1075417 RepID=A0A1G9RDT4_9BACT|nr:hypothetical protein [Catalinimonas alkaloidigena]SDM21462.1 hypothetical protein SAMN05421823_111125 [Catalinimonas alkaloidigena]
MELGLQMLSLRNRLRRPPATPTARRSVSFAKARRIGLFVASDSEATWQQFGKIRDQLLKMGKEVTSLAYLSEIPNDPALYKTKFFTNKDISLLGQIKSEEVTHFMAADFDYLYCLTTDVSPLYESILGQSQARCRVGRFSPELEHNLELMVDLKDGESLATLWEKMLRLTQAIQNNDA